jgi:hypothetical protein
LDREEKALVRELDSLDDNLKTVCRVPTGETRLTFYETIVPGDSGNPLFMVIDGDLALLATWRTTSAGSGPAIHAYLAEINAAMVALDTANGFTPDKTLTEIDLSGFNDYGA